VLVATDIAARGIDVAEIGHVVNYDLPHVPADYVHRVGRTARASASGRASSFCAPDEAGLLKDIERFTHKPIARAQVPRESPLFKAELAKQPEGGSQQHGHAKRQHHAQALQQQHHAKPAHHPKPSASHPKPSANQPRASARTHAPQKPVGGSHSITVFSGGPKRRR
jgi:ATP-dependent RNA helicase RhlE